MPMTPTREHHFPAFVAWFLTIGATAFFAFFLAGAASPRPPLWQEAPGPLSKAHAPLEGAANCGKCHGDDMTIGAERCLACHAPIAARIAAKKGVHREVAGDCQVCHIEHQGADADLRPLDPKEFDHAAETGFPLEGKHAGLAANCPACHKTRSYLNNSPDCSSCHVDPHQGGMKQSCASCHTPAGWERASRAFHKAGLFPLEGRHLSVPCASCHLDGRIKGTPTRCYDCHWVRRQDDPYRTRLGNECEECHRPASWTAVTWDHGSRTGLPLNGAHRTLNCDACHKGRVFAATSFDCYACHREDYEEAGDPDHVRAGFPTSCEICHRPSDTSFGQARFDHAGAFPLQGRHATLDCAACHKNNVYAGTPRDCYGCHRSDYESTRDPNHAAAGFPTSCDSCHRPTDTSFSQGRFDHLYFPIASGRHAGNACSACHPDSSNFKVFNCLGCHGRSQTDSHHGGVSGYSYNSQACYSCHPQGRG